jgi:hypothetical protein
MKKFSPQIYLATACGAALALLGVVALFNAFTDNHGLVFNLNRRPLARAFDPSEIRVLKRNLVYRRYDYEAAVFGTSRALYGFDCSHPFWGTQNAINAAMPGITFQEMGEAICHFITHQKPKKILITLDYGSFTPSKDPFHYDFQSHPAKHLGQAANDLFITFLSVDTLTQSLVSLCSKQRLYDPHAALDNQTVLARTLKQGDLHKSFQKAEVRCAEFWGKSEPQMIDSNLVRRIILEAKKRDVELFWLFNPFHHHLVSFFKKRDGLQAMLDWRREMAELLLESGERRVFAWDSCKPVSLSIDELIQEAQGGLPLFFEMSHFSQRLGNRMMDQLASENHTTRDSPEQILLIQKDNLSLHLQTLAELWGAL